MGIDNKYLIFKNIQPNLIVSTTSTVDSVLAKLKMNGITFKITNPTNWVVNFHNYSLTSQNSTTIEIIIDRTTIDLSNIEFGMVSYLKIKNRLGQALYLERTGSTITTITFTANNINSIGFYEFGFGMKKTECYKFNYEDVLGRKIFPYDFVNHIDEDNLNVIEDINQDITLSNGEVIPKDSINSDVKYKTIPKYNIGADKNKQSMKLSVFKTNISNNSSENGNYSFNTALSYGSLGYSSHAKYWASYPEIYPRIIYNTTEFKENDAWMTIESNTNKIKIQHEDDNYIYYDFNPMTDKLILYIREPGTWKAEKKHSLWEIDFNKHLDHIWGDTQIVDDSNTATLTFNDIKIYDLSNIKKDTVFRMNSYYLKPEGISVNNSDLKYKIYKNIIKIPNKVTIDLPPLNKPMRESQGDFSISIGKYDQNGKLLKKPCFEMKLSSIKGYQFVSGENKSDVNIKIEENSYGSYTHIDINSLQWPTDVKCDFYCGLKSNPGLLPSEMPYYGDCNYSYEQPEEEGRSKYTLKVNGMNYEFTHHLYQYTSEWKGILKMYVGYTVNSASDAIAVVVWHNIKQEGE